MHGSRSIAGDAAHVAAARDRAARACAAIRDGDRRGADCARSVAYDAARVLSAVDRAGIGASAAIRNGAALRITDKTAGIIPAAAASAHARRIGAAIHRAFRGADDTAYVLIRAGDRRSRRIRAVRDRAFRGADDTARVRTVYGGSKGADVAV